MQGRGKRPFGKGFKKRDGRKIIIRVSQKKRGGRSMGAGHPNQPKIGKKEDIEKDWLESRQM